MHLDTRAILAAALLAAFPAAQSQTLIGFAADPAAPSSTISQQVRCDPTRPVCTVALPAPSAPFAGGATYDPRHESLWHTQGTRLMEVLLPNCAPRCTTGAYLALGPNSLAGGLTFDHVHQLMYQVESIPGWAAIVTYDMNVGAGNCPRQIAACRVQLPTPDHRAGAIAYDHQREVLYVASSNFAAGAAPENIIYVAKAADPCNPFCKLELRACGTGLLQAIRAMCYDECEDTLRVSDGRQTTRQAVVWRNCPELIARECCPTNSTLGQFWYGFDMLPTDARRLGTSCSAPPCANCPTLLFDTFGAPVVGNGQFGFVIENAPANSTAFALIGFGGCQPIPFGCDRIYPALPTPALGPVPTGGVGVCDGSAFFPLAIPNAHGLCGALLCTQGVVICPAFGISLTNAQVVSIGS